MQAHSLPVIGLTVVSSKVTLSDSGSVSALANRLSTLVLNMSVSFMPMTRAHPTTLHLPSVSAQSSSAAVQTSL